MFFTLVDTYEFFYGIPEVPGVFKTLPGVGGFAVIQQEPVARHGIPVRAHNYYILYKKVYKINIFSKSRRRLGGNLIVFSVSHPRLGEHL